MGNSGQWQISYFWPNVLQIDCREMMVVKEGLFCCPDHPACVHFPFSFWVLVQSASRPLDPVLPDQRSKPASGSRSSSHRWPCRLRFIFSLQLVCTSNRCCFRPLRVGNQHISQSRPAVSSSPGFSTIRSVWSLSHRYPACQLVAEVGFEGYHLWYLTFMKAFRKSRLHCSSRCYLHQ